MTRSAGFPAVLPARWWSAPDVDGEHMLEGPDIQFVQRPLALPGAVTWLPRYVKTSTGHLERPAVGAWIKERGWGACIARRRREAPEVLGVD